MVQSLGARPIQTVRGANRGLTRIAPVIGGATSVAADAAAAAASASAAATSASSAATAKTNAETAETNAEAAQAAAEAARDDAVDISNISTSDGVVEALVRNTGGGGPLTTAALSATIRAPRIHHLDSYNRFFGSGKWVTGQATTGTTTTASVSAGASVIPAASASGLSAGVQLVVAEGAAQQKIYTVAAVAGNDVTISGTVTYAIASGAAVTPLWSNSTHLTTVGYRAFAYFIANAQTLAGEYVITGTAPKVTFLGNSWISQGGTVYGDELDDRIPGATAVNAGVAGNTSAQLLARFDTDVPADSDYVVFNEPGVNDDAGYVTPSTQSTQLQQLIAKILAIGAIPVYTGHVPLADTALYTATQAARVTALLGSDGALGTAGTPDIGTAYLPETDSTGLGTGALLKLTTGVQDTAVGARAGAALTTGFSNSLFGREAGTALTTGGNNTGLGHNTLRALATGSGNTAVGQACLSAATAGENSGLGQNASLAVSTGTGNTALGKDAGYNVNGSTAKGTTTGSYQTAVGYRAGGSTGNSYSTAVGANSEAGGYYSTALGSATAATALGSAAIGRDSAGTGASSSVQDEIGLGTALHTTRIAGYLRIDRGQTTVGAAGAASALPATPTKYLSVKDSAGTEYVFPVYAKA